MAALPKGSKYCAWARLAGEKGRRRVLGSLPPRRGPLLTRPPIVQLKYKLMKITVNAALQRQFHSPFIFREEDPSRQVSPWGPCRPGPEPGQLGKGYPAPYSFPTL